MDASQVRSLILISVVINGVTFHRRERGERRGSDFKRLKTVSRKGLSFKSKRIKAKACTAENAEGFLLKAKESFFSAVSALSVVSNFSNSAYYLGIHLSGMGIGCLLVICFHKKTTRIFKDIRLDD